MRVVRRVYFGVPSFVEEVFRAVGDVLASFINWRSK